MAEALERAVRDAGARIIAALAAHYRDLDIAEDAFAEACARAARSWKDATPERPDAWLYRAAERAALDLVRKRQVRARLAPEPPEPEPSPEDVVLESFDRIPNERLRLIFVCCHPAVAAEARAALTLKVVCGLSTAEIARSFLVLEPTLAQRLVRAKRKIAEAGVPFEILGPEFWAERLDSVLSTLEIAYSKAHEDASGGGPHAGYASEILTLSALLAELLPNEPDVFALAALVRFAEARRPARVDAANCMLPLSEQDPALWSWDLIVQGKKYLQRGFELAPSSVRLLRAAIHAAWCTRRALVEPAPWGKVLALYDALVMLRSDPITRLNRPVALAEVKGPKPALREILSLGCSALDEFPPFHATLADLLRRCGRLDEAARAYAKVLALGVPPAEAAFIRKQLAMIRTES